MLHKIIKDSFSIHPYKIHLNNVNDKHLPIFSAYVNQQNNISTIKLTDKYQQTNLHLPKKSAIMLATTPSQSLAIDYKDNCYQLSLSGSLGNQELVIKQNQGQEILVIVFMDVIISLSLLEFYQLAFLKDIWMLKQQGDYECIGISHSQSWKFCLILDKGRCLHPSFFEAVERQLQILSKFTSDNFDKNNGFRKESTDAALFLLLLLFLFKPFFISLSSCNYRQARSSTHSTHIAELQDINISIIYRSQLSSSNGQFLLQEKKIVSLRSSLELLQSQLQLENNSKRIYRQSIELLEY